MELKYAQANYPGGWRWKLLLFAVGGCFGLFSSLIITLPFQGGEDFIVMVGGVGFGGIGFAWLLPVNMRYVIPQK